MVRFWLGVVAIAAGCSDLREGQCRTTDDCDAGFTCVPEGYVDCTIVATTDPSTCPGQAEGDACEYTDVGVGQKPGVCDPELGPCGEARSMCRPDCNADGQGRCAEGEVCEANGTCRTMSCETGEWTCSAAQTCNPSAANADVNGCSANACVDDDTCGNGQYCVVGFCYEIAGSCVIDTLAGGGTTATLR